MHTIETYKPVVSHNPMVQLFSWLFYRFKRQLPQEWNELTEKQLCLLPEILIHKELTNEAARILIADKFLQLPAWVIRSFDTAQMYDLIQTLSFLFEKPALTKTVIKKFPCRGKTYYGPADSWYDLCFGEYRDVVKYLKYYSESKDAYYLRLIAAVLYRQKDWRGRKKKYMPADHVARAGRFETLAPEFLQAIMFQVYGCLNEIESEFFEVFEEGDEDADIETLVNTMCGPVFGDQENTFYAPLWSVMHEMRRLVRKEREQEKQNRNNEQSLA